MKAQTSPKKQIAKQSATRKAELKEDKSRNAIKTMQPQGNIEQKPDLRREVSQDVVRGRSSATKSYNSIASHVDIEDNSPLKGSPSKVQSKTGEVTVQVLQGSFGKNAMTAVQINSQKIQIEQEISKLNDQQQAEQVVKSEKIKVAVRVRPFLQKEIAKESVCYVSKNGTQIRVSDLTHTVEGQYDKVFPKETSQQEAYSFVSDCIPNLLQGFNCTIFAYGQTGSGKTYTMFGSEEDWRSLDDRRTNPMQQSVMNIPQKTPIFDSDSGRVRRSLDQGESFISNGLAISRKGIIPRSISELFSQIRANSLKYTIYCSFLQIYNEKLYDLLQDTDTKNPLQIREEKFQGIYVEGLSEYVVSDEIDCLNLLNRGEKNRIKRATKMNIRSSRSHTLFQMLLETDKVDSKGMLKRSKLNLGDLAGSEKVNKDEEMKAKHMLELRNINLSLTTLGKVIQILSQGSSSTGQSLHIPFRESKLTRLLQDSLGGNCQTYLIATVSPFMDSIEETISTLKFADRAKCVMQRVKKNEINAKDDALVQKLQREVLYLKELLQMKRQGFNPKDLSHQLYILKDENERLKQMAMNYEDVEKMKQENKAMRLELQRLRQNAVSDVGSLYGGGDSSPRSNNGGVGFFNIANEKKLAIKDEDSITEQTADHNKQATKVRDLPHKKLQKKKGEDGDDSDQSIEDQFNHYKSELNFEVKLTNMIPDSKVRGNSSKFQSTLMTNRSGHVTTRHLNQEIGEDTSAILAKQKDLTNLKQQKERLNQVLSAEKQEKYHMMQHSVPRIKQPFAVKKRYIEGDLSDEGINLPNQKILTHINQQPSNVTLPLIQDPSLAKQSQQVYSKVEFNRKQSTSLIPQQSPYTLQSQDSANTELKPAQQSYQSDFTRYNLNSIQKYPNGKPLRNSLGSGEDLPTFGPGQNQMSQIAKDINRSYQIGSSGMVGLTTSSSLYGVVNQGSQVNKTNLSQINASIGESNKSTALQTVVRIRGRHNKLIETRGNIMMTMDEEKKLEDKKKQLRRSNERLRMLETLERARQDKMEKEISRLEQDRVTREQEALRKREFLKQRRLAANGQATVREVTLGGGTVEEQKQYDDNFLGSGRGQALIPRSQVLDVLKNLNIREGIFSEDELKLMENGYSVSESGDDMLSLRSGHSAIEGVGSIHSPANAELYDQLSRGNRQTNDNFDEQRIRHTQERSLLQSEIANQRSRYIKKMGSLEKALEQLKGEKRELQQVIETQKHNFKLQLIQQDQRAQEQLREIKETQFKLQGQVPNFKEKLDLYKKEFVNGQLLVSEEKYVEIKSKRDEDQSLKEFLQVKVYESMEKKEHEVESIRRENDELAEINMQMKVKMDRDLRELESLKKMLKDREEDNRRKSDAQERKIRDLESDLHKLNNQYKVIVEKGLQQREVDDRFRQLEIDHKSLSNQYKMLEDNFNKIQSLKAETEKRSEGLRREIDLLNQDKTFLTRENVSLEERFKRVEEKLDRTEAELLETKRSASKYMERVLSTNDEVKSKFDREYSQEMNDLKERHQRELELAKSNLTEIYEKRLEHMRERKEDFERRVLKLEQDYHDKSRSYEELLVELRLLQRTSDEEIGRLKLAVMSRGDEQTRVSHLYEDNMILVKDMKIENEALRSKIDVLKSEYYKLESQARQGNADIKAELAVLKERLASYELIEKELDSAIMNVANNDNLDGEGIDGIGSALIQTITSAPTAAKRRIQQSLLLANRLQTKQKENEALLREIKELKDKLENQEGEVKFHKRLMEKSGQPVSYMMADMERSEKELNFAQKKIKKQDDEIKRLNKENEQLVLQKKGLNEDLQKLIARRQDIENLYTTLQGIISHSSAKKIDIDELKHKLAESIRSNSYKNQSMASKENARRMNRSRSKSPATHLQQYSSDEIPEKGSAVKMYQENDTTPAWYKALKKQVGNK